MAERRQPKLIIAALRGRDGSTPPLEVPNHRAVEMVNVDLYESSLGRKRGGSENQSLSGGTAQTGIISFLQSFVVGADQAAREMWSIDDAATPRWKRLSGGATWADVTINDVVTGAARDVAAVAFDGKIFFGYDSAVNRLHVWDPSVSQVRRVGLAQPAAPSVANTGVGSYPNARRYYKVVYETQVSGVPVRRSELSVSVSFTPSGSGTAARITKPAAINEGETHWRIYGSTNDSFYFEVAVVAVGTTTYDDSGTPSAYAGASPDDVGSRVVPPSARYLIADDSRVIGAGIFEAEGTDPATFTKARRVWWTAPQGATDIGDSERVSNTSGIKGYDDIEEPVTGLGGPIYGSFYAFSYSGCWKFISTGIASAPYVSFRVTAGFGCISHKSIILSQDENGEACLYWLSPVGPIRTGRKGQQRCHEDIDDIWRTVNLSATSVVCHGADYRDKHQIWWWVATGASNDPDTIIKFDTKLGRVSELETSIRNGWVKHTGPSAAARCSTAMSSTIGASMSRELKPYIGRSSGTLVWKCDSGVNDAGTSFQGYVKSKAYMPWGLGRRGGMTQEAMLVARAQAGSSASVTMYRDHKATGIGPFVASLSPQTDETLVYKQLDESIIQDANSIQAQIGDQSASDNQWNLDALVIPISDSGDR